MRIQVLRSAISDLGDARLFYEQQSDGLGEYFLNSLFSDIDSLVLHAGVHQQHFGFYRLLAKRFPYAVYYKINKSTILVFRVLDLRQSPAKIENSLS